MNYTKLVVRLLLALTAIGTLVFYVGCSKDEPFAPLDNAANATGEPEGIATPLFPDNIPDTPPVPESEIAEIIFSEKWLSENNKSDSPVSFNITFPTKWLDESPKLSKIGEPVVKLRAPKEKIYFSDENPDPDVIKISFPSECFYPDKDDNGDIPETEETEDSIDWLNKSRGIETDLYQERRWFNKKQDDIIGLYGYIYQGSHSNNGESYTNYDETEIYLTSDTPEIVNAYSGNTNGTTTRKVHWVIYDNGGNCQWLISMTPKTYNAKIYFYFTMNTDLHGI